MKRFFSFLFLLISYQIVYSQNINPLVCKTDSVQQAYWVDSVFNSLTLKERIAQLFMVAAYSNKDDLHTEEIATLIEKYKIGGLIFFQGGPVRQAQLTNYYQSLSKVPLLIGIDAEWGLRMRLDSTISYPRQITLGATRDTILTYQMAADIARQLKRIGVHINFAPVIDINNNPNNPVIGTRSFGENRDLVFKHGLAYVKGLQDNGVLACIKHFPGHGDTNADSHYTLPVIDHTANRIDSIELYPFKNIFSKGVASVMVAHLQIPSLEPDTLLPSTLSNRIVGQKLISELGFNGLVITDALNMKGVAAHFDAVDANIRALYAGNDILLFPGEIERTINEIHNHIATGRIPEEIINIKCKKVLMAKYKAGLNAYNPIKIENLYADLNAPSSLVLRRRIIKKSITVVHNNDNFLPIKRLDTLKIAYIEIGTNKGDDFREQLELYTSIKTFSIDPYSSQNEFDELLSLIEPYNTVIIGYHSISNRVSKNFGITTQAANFIFDLSFRKKTVLSLFGTPYALSKIPMPSSLTGIIISYENSFDAQNLTAQAIFGGLPVSGKLAVSANGTFTYDTGIELPNKIRLGYGIPDELGISKEVLEKVDSIANGAIATGATPGMQILAAKDGVVFYNKAFGRPTYVSEYGNDIRMLYDVASVTKVSATLPSIMMLYDSGKIDFNSELGDFIKLKEFPYKASLKIGDILRHQSGLAAWIPFYINTLTSLDPSKPLWTEEFDFDHPYKFNGKKYASRFAYPDPKFYSTDSSSSFPNNVAYRIYSSVSISDSIYKWINQSPIIEPGKYRYSDLGFLYLQRVIENSTSKKLDEYITPLYKRLGMNYTTFNPYKHFDTDRIAPTEFDPVFRKQLIWGHVHDPAAAMLGGIAGHAGLFSTANDLAKLMQLYLNDGVYGGERFFKPGTVQTFANPSINDENRRAYGFDKPVYNGPSPAGQLASPLSFGHTGFTGTIVWADPANNFIYVFLSNRVHPTAENNKLSHQDYRTKIHDLFYQAINNEGKGN